MVEEHNFKSNYFLRLLKGDYNPLTPNILNIDNNHIEYRRRNWYLISVDTENLHFQNVTGITVDKHLFGATLIIKSTGHDSIYVNGFWKKKANEIKDICSKYISFNTQRGTADAMADAISKAIGKAGESGRISVVDELKKMKELLDSGVINQDEFDELKIKLMS
ncbi:SHOCT domain-containing protein [Gelidibacter sp.]|uniref:SHOCT domain-containing protein n=1 Tax=Gelidibacter sp. TaxID=2018083 RepID=UPI0032634AE1